ncbi:hypothetical protein JTE90_019928 [Oedothorax gibbosus]|uniref:Uncharacterized protein n=1 Tax=Oedothorax gibbosus TaxID=931172 RepID=A0AAV6UQM6_9ARAC|nr:hypothetical protein JTE90_019928 [Oedothorax gibbosus]
MLDVKQIKETEVERQKVVQDALQAAGSAEFSKTNYDGNDPKILQSRQMTPRFKTQSSSNAKIPPWLVEKAGNKSDLNEYTPTPSIGPTIETLIKHVAAQEKKALPSKRIIGNVKHKSIRSEKWLPSFSGVWNKKRRRPSELNSKKK